MSRSRERAERPARSEERPAPAPKSKIAPVTEWVEEEEEPNPFIVSTVPAAKAAPASGPATMAAEGADFVRPEDNRPAERPPSGTGSQIVQFQAPPPAGSTASTSRNRGARGVTRDGQVK